MNKLKKAVAGVGIGVLGMAGLGVAAAAPASAHAEGRQWESHTLTRTYHYRVNAQVSASPAGSCDTHLVTRTITWSIYPWERGDTTSYTRVVC